MKNFQEKEIKDLATVNGGRDGDLAIGFTINLKGWFDGSMNLFDGIRHNTKVNEFDEPKVSIKYSFNF
jgi:hypothetical protein